MRGLKWKENEINESGKLNELSTLLKTLNEKGHFEASWIIDSAGLVMAEEIPNELYKEGLVAVSTVVFMQSDRIREYLNMPDSSQQITCENHHFYFRRISVAHMSFMLVATSQQKRVKRLQNYAHRVRFGQSSQEKALDWAVKEIEKIFDYKK